MLPPWCPCRQRQPPEIPIKPARAAEEEPPKEPKEPKEPTEPKESKEDGEDAGAKSSTRSGGPVRVPKAIREHLDGKGYAAALEEVAQQTALRLSDFDPKALRLLDILEQKGTARTACMQLRQTLEGIPRQRIGNWRAYIYSLIRGIDEDAYRILKRQDGVADVSRKEKPAKKEKSVEDKDDRKKDKEKSLFRDFDFQTGAAEFVPGRRTHGTAEEEALREKTADDACADALLEELASPLLEPKGGRTE